MNAQATSDSAARGSATAEDAARIDALIGEARTLARTGAAQHALAYSRSAEMLAAADARLYEAKRAGRNCVR